MVIALKLLRPWTTNVAKPIRATIFCGFLQYHPVCLQWKNNVFMFPFSLTLNLSLNTFLLLLILFFYTALLMQYLFPRTSCYIFRTMHTLKIITHKHLLNHRIHFKHALSTHCLSVITNGYMLVTEKRDRVWAEYLSKLAPRLPLPTDKIRHTLCYVNTLHIHRN
jgi:hypothetical protein